jgi:hypothetical protein
MHSAKYIVSNPPFDELIMNRMAEYIIESLNGPNEKCYFIVIPDWRPKGEYIHTEYDVYNRLSNSEYKKIEKIYSGKERLKYKDYFKERALDIGETGTIVLVLSNFKIPQKEIESTL